MINMCDMSTRPDEIYNLSYSGSTSGSPTRWRNLQKKVSRRRLDQEPGPPQLVPLNVKEQQLKPEPSLRELSIGVRQRQKPRYTVLHSSWVLHLETSAMPDYRFVQHRQQICKRSLLFL